MADENLSVDAQKLGNWGFSMVTYALSATMPSEAQINAMGPAATHAFGGANKSGEFFAEGALMQAGVERQAAAFAAFLGDLGRGIQAIGNAANVISNAYGGRDVEAAEKMNLLGYAFATDPTAKAPPGMPKGVGDTMNDVRSEQQANASDAEIGAEGGQTISVGGGLLTMYPDGSTRMTRTVTADGNVPRSVTTITNASGKVVGTTTVGYVSSGGVTTENYRQVVTPGGMTKNAKGEKVKAPDRVTTTETSTDEATGDKVIKTTIEGGEKPIVREVHVPAPTKEDVKPDELTPLEEIQRQLPGIADVDPKKGYQNYVAPS